MTEFGRLTEDGFTPLGSVLQADMLRCPHFIMALEHYRPDGSCRCDDVSHAEMGEWGYSWDAKRGRWV